MLGIGKTNFHSFKNIFKQTYLIFAYNKKRINKGEGTIYEHFL